MYYEINVALNGKHLFATHERSISFADKAKQVLGIFRDKFKADEGYEISISYHPEINYGVRNITDSDTDEQIIDKLINNE